MEEPAHSRRNYSPVRGDIFVEPRQKDYPAPSGAASSGGCDWKWVRSCRLKPAFRPQWNAGFSRQPRSAHPHLITPREPPVLLATDETRMEHGRVRDALIWLDCVTAQEQIGVAMKRLVFFSGA